MAAAALKQSQALSGEGNSQGPRVLIVRVGAMGDILHGMPAVAGLRAAWPQAHIGWAVEPRWSPLLYAPPGTDARQAHVPLVDRLHLAATKSWSKRPFSFDTARSVGSLRHSLRAERYDIAIDLQGSIRSAVIARLSGAPHVVGNAVPREIPAALLYTRKVAVTRPHVIDQAAKIVSAATNLNLQATPVALPVDEESELWASALLAAGADTPVVLIAPSAGWGAKQWPARHFGELAARLHGRGYRVLVNAPASSPDPVADAVIAASGNTAERLACNLPQLIALLRRVYLAVAGDSGPLHLAAALRVPVVAIFGPTDPARNGPYGTRSIVLRDPLSITSYRHTQHTDPGLLNITVEQALDAALHLLRDATGAWIMAEA